MTLRERFRIGKRSRYFSAARVLVDKKTYGDIMALEIIGRLGKRMKNVSKAITKAEADACRARCRRENVFVAELDGKGIKTQADLFRKTARAFKIPKRAVCADWDSFAVCLRDLSWLVCDKGFAGVSLFIYNFDELLCGSAFDKEVFTEMLRDVILPYWEGDPADNGNGAPRRFDMFMIGNSFIEEIEKALRYKEGWNEDELKKTADIFVKSGCGKKIGIGTRAKKFAFWSRTTVKQRRLSIPNSR